MKPHSTIPAMVGNGCIGGEIINGNPAGGSIRRLCSECNCRSEVYADICVPVYGTHYVTSMYLRRARPHAPP